MSIVHRLFTGANVLSDVQSTVLVIRRPGMENIVIFSKFLIFSIHIGYFRYFHFTALDWEMSIERLVFKLYISEWATKNNNNSNTALCNIVHRVVKMF